jgi:hypothetical protein
MLMKAALVFVASLAFISSGTMAQMPAPVPPCATLVRGESFDAGVTFAGQRTYIVNGYVSPTTASGQQCFALDGLNIDFDAVKVNLQVAGMKATGNKPAFDIGIDQAGISSGTPRPTIRFHITTSHAQVTKLSFQVFVTGKTAPDTTYVTQNALSGYAKATDLGNYVPYGATIGVGMAAENSNRCLLAHVGQVEVNARSPCDFKTNPELQWQLLKE